MSSILKLRYRHGQLVLLNEDEYLRLGVPKNRPWLVVQANKIRGASEVILCYLTKTVRDDGTEKPMLPTDIFVPDGLDLSNGSGDGRAMKGDGYIRCNHLYTVKEELIDEYLGTLPSYFMEIVSWRMAYCLGLSEGTLGKPSKTMAITPAVRTQEAWSGKSDEPIRKLEPSQPQLGKRKKARK